MSHDLIKIIEDDKDIIHVQVEIRVRIPKFIQRYISRKYEENKLPKCIYLEDPTIDNYAWFSEFLLIRYKLLKLINELITIF